jgi:hypothetical protein
LSYCVFHSSYWSRLDEISWRYSCVVSMPVLVVAGLVSSDIWIVIIGCNLIVHAVGKCGVGVTTSTAMVQCVTVNQLLEWDCPCNSSDSLSCSSKNISSRYCPSSCACSLISNWSDSAWSSPVLGIWNSQRIVNF